jgi:Tfp pilus assembly protein PilO
VKELVNKLLANVHILLLFYGLFGVYERWDAHSLAKTELESQVPTIEEKISKSKAKLKEITEFSKKAEESRARVEEVAKSIEAAQRQLPSETNDTQILGFFSKEMGLLNIKDAQLVPSGEETSTYYISKNYVLKAKGTFLQFLIFLERIGNAARIYNVKNLALSNSAVNQRGRFQVISVEATVQAYRFNPSFKVDRESETSDPNAVKPPGGT